ncbi:MAG: MFS transporter, partial [Asgard group archaeon]|nr:MFS transporter [Asgard group archaeon]
MLVLLVMVILVGLGEKMGERFLPLYILSVGGGTFAVSFLNGTDNLLSALYSFPGGYLSDKIGYKRALLVFNGIAMIGYLIVILVPTWWAVLIGAIFFISWTAISLPAVMSMISNIVSKDKRVMGVSAHSLVRRIPMALGPIIGGAIIGVLGIAWGMRVAFITALGLAVVASLLQWFFVKEPPKNEKEP